MPFASRFVTPLQKAVINYIGFSICKCREQLNVLYTEPINIRQDGISVRKRTVTIW